MQATRRTGFSRVQQRPGCLGLAFVAARKLFWQRVISELYEILLPEW